MLSKHSLVGWPPPPHDPRERELTLYLGDWQLRVFDGRFSEYFIPRGLWHLQLWHAERQVSVLTPSRLTSGLYEAFPIAGWKQRCARYSDMAAGVREEHAVELPGEDCLRSLEVALVDEVVRTSKAAPS